MTHRYTRVSWQVMLSRGIDVCSRWYSFQAFLEDMGYRPLDTYLERKDRHREFCKENCYWAPMHPETRRKQMRGGKRTPWGRRRW